MRLGLSQRWLGTTTHRTNWSYPWALGLGHISSHEMSSLRLLGEAYFKASWVGVVCLPEQSLEDVEVKVRMENEVLAALERK